MCVHMVLIFCLLGLLFIIIYLLLLTHIYLYYIYRWYNINFVHTCTHVYFTHWIYRPSCMLYAAHIHRYLKRKE